MQNRSGYDLQTARTFAHDLVVASVALVVAKTLGTLASTPLFAVPFYAVLRSFLPSRIIDSIVGRGLPLLVLGALLGWCAGSGIQYSNLGAAAFFATGLITDSVLRLVVRPRPVRPRFQAVADPEAWSALARNVSARSAPRSPDFAVIAAPGNTPAATPVAERQAA